MNVKNRKCIRKLSLKSLYANRRRNLIAIFAIALTTLLFTSMFTIVLSLNASYETYQFRQVGGYARMAPLRMFPPSRRNASLPTQR